MDFQVRDPVTSIGVAETAATPPSPSCPAQLSPQQYARSSLAIPHVCAEPAESCFHVREPETSTGEMFDEFAPFPSCPALPRPQQYACPSEAIPQEWFRPATIDAHSPLKLTALGSLQAPLP